MKALSIPSELERMERLAREVRRETALNCARIADGWRENPGHAIRAAYGLNDFVSCCTLCTGDITTAMPHITTPRGAWHTECWNCMQEEYAEEEGTGS